MRIRGNWNIENVIFFIGTLVLVAVLVPLEFRHSLQHWSEWVVFLVMFAAVGTGITAGYHRLFSHRAFQATPPVRFVLLCLGAASFQQSVLRWSAEHRIHHRHVDQEQDPYNSRKGFWYSHWLWILRKQHNEEGGVADLERDPLVRWQARHHYLIGTFTALALPVGVGLATNNLMGHLIIGGLLRIVATHHSTFLINSAAHAFGSRPYTDANSARDNGLLAFLTWGEGYHNFHHLWQWDYRNGVRWYQWDTTKWLVSLLSWVGLVRGLRRVPDSVIRRARLRMEEKELLERVARTAPSAMDVLGAQVRGARERLDQALAALHDLREGWELRKRETRAHLEDNWAQRKSEWAQSMERQKEELRGAWKDWKATRGAVRRLKAA